MRYHMIAFGGGFLLDLLLGDPCFLPHPVRLIGRCISAAEKRIRGKALEDGGKEIRQGAILVSLVLIAAVTVSAFLLGAAYRLHPYAGMLIEGFMTYQILAVKSLKEESLKVYQRLKEGNLIQARAAVSMIVGRDTDCLDEAGVTRAAVETVAENTSDGVIAPMLYLALGGPVLGFFYKAVNTMDSMVGYKNERCRDYGTCAARLDDVLNFVPARLSGVLLCLAAALTGLDGPNAWKIFRRDRLNHKSPNSAHTEAAAAGALRIELAGSGYYFGKLVEKPVIGDPLRPVEPEDIVRVNRLMYAGAALALLLFCAVPLAALCIFA